MDNNTKNNNYTWLLLTFLVLGAVLAAGLKVYDETRPIHVLYAEPEPLTAKHWNNSRNLFSANIKKIRKLLPLQSKRSWSTISAAVKQTLQPQPEYPAVLLLLARPRAVRTAACL